jgi:hypothetical protein
MLLKYELKAFEMVVGSEVDTESIVNLDVEFFCLQGNIFFRFFQKLSGSFAEFVRRFLK